VVRDSRRSSDAADEEADLGHGLAVFAGRAGEETRSRPTRSWQTLGTAWPS
jgi:hypothetical protein